MMIALFTDFGLEGPYTGQMKAVLAHDAPGMPVVDVFPDLPPFNIKAAAFLLPAYAGHLPDEAVCLCVVDPGVGGDRAPLAVKADGRWYVGPDNGLFGLVIRRAAHVRAWRIEWQPETLSASFHGRDLFAPVAARIARHHDFPSAPLDLRELVLPDWPDELPEVVYIDRYGNAVTGLRAAAIDRDSLLDLNGCRVGFARTFTERPAGRAFWYENANGLVEIAVNQGRADRRLRLGIGDPVRIVV